MVQKIMSYLAYVNQLIPSRTMKMDSTVTPLQNIKILQNLIRNGFKTKLSVEGITKFYYRLTIFNLEDLVVFYFSLLSYDIHLRLKRNI